MQERVLLQVVERGEWVPAVRAPMVRDVSTGTRIGVVYVMIPMTAEDGDGAIVRIMSSKDPGKASVLFSLAFISSISVTFISCCTQVLQLHLLGLIDNFIFSFTSYQVSWPYGLSSNRFM